MPTADGSQSAVVGAARDLFARAELLQASLVAIDGHVIGDVPEQQAERRVIAVERVEPGRDFSRAQRVDGAAITS
jgi:hypothetical protein